MQQEPVPTAYLMVQEGPQAGKRIEICKDCTTIGRSRNCDIFLEDISVHRKQARILYTGSGYVLRDDHGGSDSLVNEQPVTERLLKDGDQLHFGHTTLIFYAQEATRPFQLPSSRGRELQRIKQLDPSGSAIGRLDLSRRPGTIQSFELQPEVTIGRSRDCAIFLEDLAVSRLHATIRQLSNGAYEIEDHQSATGTFVNGQAITRSYLKTGDIVQIGTSRLTFHY